MVTRKYLILLSLSGFVVSLDQLTKNAVVNRFKLGETLPVVDSFFNISRVHNSGAAFGLLANLPPHLRDPFFFFVPALTLLVILAVFYKLRDTQSLSVYALASIVGGALGNIADRIRLGYVVDFLDFHLYGAWHFPAFNVADAAITTGVALLMLGMLYEKEGEESIGLVG
jgi:signal peptidase II